MCSKTMAEQRSMPWTGWDAQRVFSLFHPRTSQCLIWRKQAWRDRTRGKLWISVNSTSVVKPFCQGFGHDFEGGKSQDAQKILGSRRVGASKIMEYAGFLVNILLPLRQMPPSNITVVLTQALMLLRRFPVLNHLPIKAIQAQGIVKTTIQVRHSHSILNGQ